MKNNLLPFIIILFFCANDIAGQSNIFQNEWIDYQQTYYKIKLHKDGLYRIDKELLEQYNLPTDQPKGYQLFHKGKEIPIYASTNGSFGTNDYIEFYGEKNDGELDALLYKNPQWRTRPWQSLFTDTAAYYLTWSDTDGHSRYQNTNNDISNPPPAETHFNYKSIEVDNRTTLLDGVPFRLGGEPLHYADFGEGEGVGPNDALTEAEEESYRVATPSLYVNGGDARIEAKVIGFSDNPTILDDHHLQIIVDGTVYKDDVFNGDQTRSYSFNVPTTALNTTESETEVRFVAVEGTSEQNKHYIIHASITYPHSFDFNNVKGQTFTLLNDADKYLEITNFDGGTQTVLYDLENNLRFEPVITGEGSNAVYKFFIPQQNNSNLERHFFLANTSAIGGAGVATYAVNQLEEKQFTDFSQSQQMGNYLIISHPKLMQGEVDQAARYAEYRSSMAGGNYQVATANIEELYDQFAWGISKHPIAIRHFMNYIFEKWTITPEYLLLLGKAVVYTKTRFNPNAFEQCLVPSFGGPKASDIMLAVPDNDTYVPRVAVGRVPANNSEQLRAYLDKVIEYEAYRSDPSCSREDRLWMKNALHIAGGDNLAEANQFIGTLQKYERLYEDSLFAGNVVQTYNKLSESAVEQVDLGDVINNGLSIINFVGHSTGAYWSVDITAPTDYQNYGKYPFIMASSCFVGNIHLDLGSELSMAEDYVLADGLGSIGFLATAALGFPLYLDIYMSEVYQNFCKESYNQPIGIAIQKTIKDINENYGSLNPESDPFAASKLTVQEYILTGDPAVIINSWEEPEIAIENNSQYAEIFFEPAVINSSLDSFTVKLVVNNLGKAVHDSMTIRIERDLPNGNTPVIVNQRFAVPVYKDTLSIRLPIGEIAQAAGNNTIRAIVDADNELMEQCENNNEVSSEVFIFSDLLIPIYPCHYAIVGDETITLSASTGQPSTPVYEYIMQLDTTSNFNSPLLQEQRMSSEAGVIDWQPTVNWQDNTVYYWRARRNLADALWENSSFTYWKNEPSGWNQAHYYQFAQDEFMQMQLNENTRLFEYESRKNTIYTTNNYSNGAKVSLNGSLIVENSCLKDGCSGGLAVAVFEPDYQLKALLSEYQAGIGCSSTGTYGNIHCISNSARAVFEFNMQSGTSVDNLVNFIENDIPNGHYVLIYSINNHRLAQDPDNIYLPNIYQFFENMGLPQIQNIQNNQAFIAFGRKGIDNYPAEIQIAETVSQNLEMNLEVDGIAQQGSVFSPPIGPAKAWESMTWEAEVTDNSIFGIVVHGIRENGQQDSLTYVNSVPFDLRFIDAATYPFIRLEAASAGANSAQLKRWTVYFERYPEIALNKQAHFVFNSDTILEGSALHFEIALTNASENEIKDLRINYSVVDQNNATNLVGTVTEASIAAGATINTQFDYETKNLRGGNLLLVEVNPVDAAGKSDQAEKYRFNNVLLLPFHVLSDQVNPFIDVVFDGRHILDGDLVSAKPEIRIRIQDDSKYLALNDTSDMSLALKRPEAVTGLPLIEEVVPLSSPKVQFIPASATAAADGKNIAEIVYTPDLTDSDGVYELEVTAQDRSGNRFANNMYSISFQVVNESTISNVVNYPNPFSTSTRFVFRLTGGEVPEFFKIQIMTISGKVVRELTQTELGDIHIGQNITDYAWDGTDEFGNELANGLYLYRVVARLNNAPMNQAVLNETVKDAFKNDIGKMYILR